MPSKIKSLNKPIEKVITANKVLSPEKKLYSAAVGRRNNMLGSRLKEARIKFGLQQKDLSRILKSYDIEITSGSISKWEKGDALPNPYQLFALCIELKINDILQYFTGVKVEGTQKLNLEGRQKVQEYVDLLIASGLYSQKPARPALKQRQMKVFEFPVSAGTGSFLDGDDFDILDFPEDSIPKDAEFGVRIAGVSMMPNYADGQIAWVKRHDTIAPGEIGIFIVDGEAFIKMYSEEEPDDTEHDNYIDSNNVLHPKVVLSTRP